MSEFIHIHPKDNVAVALKPIPAGTVFEGVAAKTDIPQGHKMALNGLAENDQVVKYGFPIGHATCPIAPGEWVHTHNMKTNLSGQLEYSYHPKLNPPLPCPAPPSRASGGKTARWASATRFGSSPPWAVSTTWPRPW